MNIRAEYIIPIEGPIIQGGFVTCQAGRITAVGQGSPPAGAEPVVDCGRAVVTPGLINAHTHLEMTHLADRVPPRPTADSADQSAAFAGWLRGLFEVMQEVGDDAEVVTAAVRRGAELSLQAGVTTVGDISRLPHLSRPVLAESPIRAVSFGEVIATGRLDNRLDARLDAATDTSYNSTRLTAAVSPHAPYSCSPSALQSCLIKARRRDQRLCIHLAESPEEVTCLVEGRGPLVDFFRDAGVWDESVQVPGCRPIEHARRLGLLDDRMLAAHVNYVNDAELAMLAASGVHVAYCPRTHRAFDHPPHRFREMLAAGINVCAATDGPASNPSLSVLEELCYLKQCFREISAVELLEMVTIRAAAALGMADRVGSLTPGKYADLVVWPLTSAGEDGPGDLILRPITPSLVFVGGLCVLDRAGRISPGTRCPD